jgi:hypothetical protein
VITFLRASTEKPERLSNFLCFLNLQLPPFSLPPHQRLRFKPGQVVLVFFRHPVWLRATVLATNFKVLRNIGQSRAP